MRGCIVTHVRLLARAVAFHASGDARHYQDLSTAERGVLWAFVGHIKRGRFGASQLFRLARHLDECPTARMPPQVSERDRLHQMFWRDQGHEVAP